MHGTRRLAVLVAAGMLAFGACQASPAASGGGGGTSLEAIKQKGQILVGYVDESPFAFIDEKGELAGLDIDILRECGTRLGLPRLDGEQTIFDGLIPGVQSKRYDVVAGGLTFRTKRDEVADASVPTYLLRATALVPKGNPENLHSVDDLKKSTGKIGGVTGAIEYITISEDPAFANRTVGYPDNVSAYADLAAGRISAVVDAEALMIEYLKKNPDAKVEIASPFKWVDNGRKAVLWFRDDYDPLREAYDGCIKQIKGDGTMATILTKYGYPKELVTDVNADLSDQAG